MERFIIKTLPENGIYRTADLFREKYVEKQIGVMAQKDANNEFCDLLHKVASVIDDIGAGIYDPTYIKEALKIIREEEAEE